MKFIIPSLLCLFFLSFVFSTRVFADGGMIIVSPSSGTFAIGNTFPVSIQILSGGTPFNVASATITPSTNLSVEDLQTGDCNFIYITTPSTTNLSFVGGIGGGDSLQCTIYTATMKALTAGPATISVTNGKIIARQGAVNIYSSATNGTYTIGGTTSTSNTTPSVSNNTTTQTSGNTTIVIPSGTSTHTQSGTEQMPTNFPTQTVSANSSCTSFFLFCWAQALTKYFPFNLFFH